MRKDTYSASLQSIGGNVNKRVDEIITQFNEWLNGANPTVMQLSFTTSEQYPLRMEEVAKFFDGSPYFSGEHNVEWDFTTDASLNEDMRVDILDRTEL